MSATAKMTALADEVRELSGTTDKKGIDEMTNDVAAANDEIDEQADLLAQVVAALDGKAAGSGGGITLPTLDNPAAASDILSGKKAIDGSGNVLTGTIATKTSSNLTASGATVTVPAGYYASQVTKSVSTATQATPSVSIDSNGKISASATQTAGYVSAGTKTGTKQLTTQAAKTITPTTSNQTAVSSGVYTTGAITVGAIPSTYIQPSGTRTITANGTYDVKSYASATVSIAATGEDVTDETNAYTEKVTQLTNAVTALENELAGKASGGSAGVNLATSTVQITNTNGIACLAYTSVENGTLISKYSDSGLSGSRSISCLCGTILSINLNYQYDITNVVNLVPVGRYSNVCFYQVVQGDASLQIYFSGNGGAGA